MSETRAEICRRLNAEGRRKEADKFRIEKIQEMKAAGYSQRVRREEAWRLMAEAFPPLDPQDPEGDSPSILEDSSYGRCASLARQICELLGNSDFAVELQVTAILFEEFGE